MEIEIDLDAASLAKSLQEDTPVPELETPMETPNMQRATSEDARAFLALTALASEEPRAPSPSPPAAPEPAAVSMKRKSPSSSSAAPAAKKQKKKAYKKKATGTKKYAKKSASEAVPEPRGPYKTLKIKKQEALNAFQKNKDAVMTSRDLVFQRAHVYSRLEKLEKELMHRQFKETRAEHPEAKGKCFWFPACTKDRLPQRRCCADHLKTLSIFKVAASFPPEGVSAADVEHLELSSDDSDPGPQQQQQPSAFIASEETEEKKRAPAVYRPEFVIDAAKACGIIEVNGATNTDLTADHSALAAAQRPLTVQGIYGYPSRYSRRPTQHGVQDPNQWLELPRAHANDDSVEKRLAVQYTYGPASRDASNGNQNMDGPRICLCRLPYTLADVDSVVVCPSVLADPTGRLVRSADCRRVYHTACMGLPSGLSVAQTRHMRLSFQCPMCQEETVS
jgi:hypothetical protein